MVFFRESYWTRETIVATQVLIQNCYDQRKDVCLCFIDYDKVQHHEQIAQLRKLDKKRYQMHKNNNGLYEINSLIGNVA